MLLSTIPLMICMMIHGTNAPLISGLMALAKPEIYMAGAWIWSKREHWVFHPSEFKLSMLHGLVGGPPWADQEIKWRIEKGYLDNEVALYTIPKYQNLIFYLIEHKLLKSDIVLEKSLVYSNYKLMKEILKKFRVPRMLSSIIYAYQHFLWNIIDQLLIGYQCSNSDLEFLLSDRAYDGLVTYLFGVKKINPVLTLKLAAKYGNTYITKNMIENGLAVPNYNTLVLASGSGNVHLVKYLCEEKNIEPEMIAVKNSGSLAVISYFLDTLQVPLYNGVFQTICEKGDLKSVMFFLEEKLIVPGFDIVTISVRSGSLELLRYLFDKGFKGSNYNLEEAAKYGRLEAFKYLSLERNIQSSEGILGLACSSGNVSMIRYMIEDLSYLPTSACIEAVVASGSLDGFLYLVNLPHVTISSNSLVLACYGGNVVIFNYLIEKFDLKPDITCLNEALRRGHRQIVLFIHNLHNSLFLEANSETLMAAIDGQNLEFIEYLLPQNKPKEKQDGLSSILFNYLHPKSKEMINGVLFEDSDGSSQGTRTEHIDPRLKKKIFDNVSGASLKITEDYTHNDQYKRIYDSSQNLPSEIVIDNSYPNDDNLEIDDEETVSSENEQFLDNSIMTERDPLTLDHDIMVKVFENGTPEILEYFSRIDKSWIYYLDIPYIIGNMALVEYLIKVKRLEPISYHIKLAASSGNVELLKYLFKEKEVKPDDDYDYFDFACILGQINTILFAAKNNYLKVDNLLLDLANESQNHDLIHFLSAFKPKKLGSLEYYWRRRQAYSFRKQHYSSD